MSSMHRGNTSGYHSVRDEEQEVATVSWKKFYVYLAGKTNGAHHGWVENLRYIGQTEVDSPERSDYILVFCPIVSRVGTDIGEALESAETRFPGGKQIILVVMHHTFDRDHVIAESRRLVKNPNVRLTVDCLFHEGELLQCNCNDAAWSEVKKFLGVSQNTGSGFWHIWFMWFWQMCMSLFIYARKYPIKAVVALTVIFAVMAFVFWWRNYEKLDNPTTPTETQTNHS